MDKLTPTELDKIMQGSIGKLTSWQCRTLVSYMLGYMRHANDIETARNEYFGQVKAAIEGKPIPHF